MKTFTHIEFNPNGDSYDVYFVDDKPLMQGDYYDNKVTDMFAGIRIYLAVMFNEEFSLVKIEAETKEVNELWYRHCQFDANETLSKYLTRISKDFNLIQK